MRTTVLQRARRRLALDYSVETLRRVRGWRRRRYSPFGFLDLLGLAPDKPPLAVRLAVDEAEAFALAEVLAQVPAVAAWLAQGNDLQVWTLTSDGWRKQRRWLVLTIGGIRETQPGLARRAL